MRGRVGDSRDLMGISSSVSCRHSPVVLKKIIVPEKMRQFYFSLKFFFRNVLLEGLFYKKALCCVFK